MFSGEWTEAKTLLVATVADGAERVQGLISCHRGDAVRMLDFPHAVEYLTALGSTVYAQPGA